MKKVIALVILCVMLAVSGLFAQTDRHTDESTQQNKPMTKQELADAVANAHYLANLYYFRYARKGGKEKEWKAYLYWLERRQELLKQYNEARD
jgi:uncharacterized protein YxeA